MSTACSVQRSASCGRWIQADKSSSDWSFAGESRAIPQKRLSFGNRSHILVAYPALTACLGVAPRLGDARQPQAAVAVLRELLQQLLVLGLCRLEAAAGLLHARQVVSQGDLQQEKREPGRN